jgi:hypothetical protein
MRNLTLALLLAPAPGIGAVGVAQDHRIAEIYLAGANLIHVREIVKMASFCIGHSAAGRFPASKRRGAEFHSQ